MPIRPELRHLYSGPEWKATRTRILEREGNKCKQCKVPNHATIARINKYRGWWFTPDGEAHNTRGELCFHFRGSEFETPDRIIRIVLTVAHLDRIPGNDSDDNLVALCQFCHLNYDRPVNKVQAKSTRTVHKDEARPILQACKDHEHAPGSARLSQGETTPATPSTRGGLLSGAEESRGESRGR